MNKNHDIYGRFAVSKGTAGGKRLIPSQLKKVKDGEAVVVTARAGKTIRDTTYFRRSDLLVSKEFAAHLHKQGDIVRQPVRLNRDHASEVKAALRVARQPGGGKVFTGLTRDENAHMASAVRAMKNMKPLKR